MKPYDLIMIRFGELNTKKKNKADFITKLYQNIRHSLKNCSGLKFEKAHDRIYLHLTSGSSDVVVARLKEISGIQSFSLAYRLEPSIEVMKAEALLLLNSLPEGSFKVSARRSNKHFELDSMEINQKVGGYLMEQTNRTVLMHHPDHIIRFEVRNEGVFLFASVETGQGGFPLGSLGKSMLLLSGGIDSPVAAYLMMKRGVKVEAVHFASPPYTSPGAQKKVIDSLKVLAEIQGAIRLHVVTFTALQERIYELPQTSYAITIMRRMMYRIAERLAEQNRCPVLSSGESIGQVASQTLESMRAIDGVIRLPMIRPLAVMDKNDIIQIARRIGTFDISIRPFTDCCTIFEPKSPITKPTIRRCQDYENRLNYEPLLEQCIAGVQSFTITPDYVDVTDQNEFF